MPQECPQKAVRLLLLNRQQLLLHILLWDITGHRAQLAWMIIAANACACGHGDAVCAEANIDHMLAFGETAVTSLADRLETCSQNGKRRDWDPATSCLAESCIMAAKAINTAVQAIADGEVPDPALSSEDAVEPSPRYGNTSMAATLIAIALLQGSSRQLSHVSPSNSVLCHDAGLQLFLRNVRGLIAAAHAALIVDSRPGTMPRFLGMKQNTLAFMLLLGRSSSTLCGCSSIFAAKTRQPLIQYKLVW